MGRRVSQIDRGLSFLRKKKDENEDDYLNEEVLDSANAASYNWCRKGNCTQFC